jgi:hypothetical protein
VRGFDRLNQEGAPALDQALSFWGFQPAPKSITQPQRAEHFQHMEREKAYRARAKEKGRIEYFNAPRNE